jgi:hypothetical protein
MPTELPPSYESATALRRLVSLRQLEQVPNSSGTFLDDFPTHGRVVAGLSEN